MPTVGTYSNNSALFRSMVPFRSYAQMAAQRDQDLKYATALEEQARQDQQLNEQKIRLQQETLSAMKSLPFEAPDQQKIKEWWSGKQRAVAKHIEDQYNGDVEKFNQVEGAMWLQNDYNELLSTDLYNNAMRNKEMVAMAKEAIKKGDNLIGRVGDNGDYINAEQDLLNYYNGSTPTFSFSGSYSPKSNVYDHFAKMDNPYGSKFDRTAMAPEQDVLAFLQAEKGDRAGMDIYYRQFRGRSVPYKRYALEDQQIFQMDMANKQSQIDSRNTNAQASLLRAQKAGQQENVGGYTDAMQMITSWNVGTTPFDPVTDSSVKLNNLGVSVGDLTVKAADGKDGLEFVQLSGLTLGNNFSKYTGIRKGGQVKGQAIVPNGGGHVIELNKIPHTIVGADPNIYVDQREYNNATIGNTLPGREFKKVTIEVDRKTALDNGWITSGNWNPFREDELTTPMKSAKTTKSGEKIEKVTVDIMVPSKGFFMSPETKNLANKAMFGQKRANDIQDQVQQAFDEFQSAADNE